VEEMRAKIRGVLSDPSLTTNARRISEQTQRYGGASEATQLIEEFSQDGNN
jgi:UDP:flavonoid glycosyltransferase YjiC (YdhE family)